MSEKAFMHFIKKVGSEILLIPFGAMKDPMFLFPNFSVTVIATPLLATETTLMLKHKKQLKAKMISFTNCPINITCRHLYM